MIPHLKSPICIYKFAHKTTIFFQFSLASITNKKKIQNQI